ncbi:hypothetical protein GON05_22700 [Paenibacillus sp. MAH-34]|uniref:Uncharacterized protein n=1 Tax=Paenibacillus anseongense TaxID=2682845 RepID=A0ABW9UDA0_9BACL|nr:hypothetical protein [Paenibacillus anseongense]MVQ37436.1 hypothetical protein [Paenibacillus anseongense]
MLDSKVQSGKRKESPTKSQQDLGFDDRLAVKLRGSSLWPNAWTVRDANGAFERVRWFVG